MLMSIWLEICFKVCLTRIDREIPIGSIHITFKLMSKLFSKPYTGNDLINEFFNSGETDLSIHMS